MRFKRQVIIAVLLFCAMKSQFYPTVVPSESMVPTLLVNDYIFYSKTDKVEEGDVILLQLDGKKAFLTKRVIAMGEGKTVEVKYDGVYVDNIKRKDEIPLEEQGYIMEKITLKEGELFVMGDNRTNSADGRVFGPIKESNVKGKLFLRIPFGKIIEEE